MMHSQFFKRIESGSSTKFASKIYQVVREVESEIKEYERSKKGIELEPFESPLLAQIKLSKWEDNAFRRRWSCITGSPIQLMYSRLEVWYVALRMCVQSWEEEEQLVLQWLIINNAFCKEGWFSPKLESS